MADLLSLFADVVLPVFLVAAAGFALARLAGVKADTLNSVVYYVFGPAFVFTLFLSTEIELDVLWRMAVMMTAVMAVVVVVAVAIGRTLGFDRKLVGALVLVAVYPNAGNFGLSVVQFQFGESALSEGAVYLLVVSVIAFAVGVGAATSANRSWPSALFSSLTSPLILGVYAAVLVRLLGFELPLGVSRATSLLGSAMIPTMLVTLGVALATMARPQLDAGVWTALGLKLIAMPALAFAGAIMLGLSGRPGDVGVVQAAMPTAVFSVVIAVEHDLEPGFVTSVVLATTIGSMVTLTAVLALV